MSITLRTVTVEDEAFLLNLYGWSRAAELAMTPWTPEQREAFVRMQFAAQDSFYRKEYPDAEFNVILRDGEPVGRLYVRRETDLIRIMDIIVLPDFRNLGVGAELINNLLEEAVETERPVQIFVETFNPSLAFFQKRGFSVLSEEGINLLLEWRPATAGTAAR